MSDSENHLQIPKKLSALKSDYRSNEVPSYLAGRICAKAKEQNQLPGWNWMPIVSGSLAFGAVLLVIISQNSSRATKTVQNYSLASISHIDSEIPEINSISIPSILDASEYSVSLNPDTNFTIPDLGEVVSM